jgi:CPA2 family monovalent cation:H+ antiporter-2
MSYGPKLATGLGRFTKLKRFIKVDSVEDVSDKTCKMCDHIIIAGYGFAGKELSMALKNNDIPYIVIDINIENVQLAANENQNVVYGDITREDVLNRLGITNAKELVLLINDPSASEYAIRNARRLAPGLFITVRTTYLLDIELLKASGANEVIAAEREAAVQVAYEILNRNNIDSKTITRQTENIRDHTEDE